MSPSHALAEGSTGVVGLRAVRLLMLVRLILCPLGLEAEGELEFSSGLYEEQKLMESWTVYFG